MMEKESLNTNISKQISSEEVLRSVIEIITGIVGLIPEIPELEDMSTTELYVFLFTAVSKDASNSMLAKQLNISKSAVSIATKFLIEKNLIASKQSSRDRRHTFLVLTGYGKNVYKKLLGAFENLLANVYASLKDKDTAKLESAFEILESFAKRCKELKDSKYVTTEK